MAILQKFLIRYFDYKIGLAGGLAMGVIVFFINYFPTADLLNSTIAATKQGVYTFFFGGIIMKLAETISIRVGPYCIAILLALVVPSFISILLTFGVHNLKGTSRPFESTIPTAIFVIPSTFIWGVISRKRVKM